MAVNGWQVNVDTQPPSTADGGYDFRSTRIEVWPVWARRTLSTTELDLTLATACRHEARSRTGVPPIARTVSPGARWASSRRRRAARGRRPRFRRSPGPPRSQSRLAPRARPGRARERRGGCEPPSALPLSGRCASVRLIDWGRRALGRSDPRPACRAAWLHASAGRRSCSPGDHRRK